MMEKFSTQDCALSRNKTGRQERRGKNSLPTKNTNFFEIDATSLRRHHSLPGQIDFKDVSHERAVLEAYGIIPKQKRSLTFLQEKFNLTAEWTTAQESSNVRYIIASFLG